MRIYTGPKKPAPKDWHPADIIAALHKARHSLRRLSNTNGLGHDSLRAGLRRQWPNAERIIAAAIGVPPQRIWPSRYERDGRPKRKRLDIPFSRGAGRPQKGRFGGKHSSGAGGVNVNRERGNSRAEPGA